MKSTRKRVRKQKSSKLNENPPNSLNDDTPTNINDINSEENDDLKAVDNSIREKNKNEEILTIMEEIHSDDTVITFYNRIQNLIFDKLYENANYKFILIIQSKTELYNDEQLKIFSEPVPPNYEIPLISPPILISIGKQTLPPIKQSALIDNGFRFSKIDAQTGVRIIQDQLYTLSDTQNTYFKRTDDPNTDKDHSFVLNAIKYGTSSVTDIKMHYTDVYQQLLKNGFIKNKKLTKRGEFSSEFEDFLFYEHVIMNSYIESQNENDQTSAFLLSLLILQIIRYGDEIVDDFSSENFVNNYDECSDLVTIIKSIFPLLKYDQKDLTDGFLNEKERYAENGFNPEKCEVIVNFLAVNYKIYFNMKNEGLEVDDDGIYTEYCEAVDQLQAFLFDIHSKINEFIKIIEQSIPKFFQQHEHSFVSIMKDQSIIVKSKNKEKAVSYLKNRPGWSGYSIPKKFFAFSITSSASNALNTPSKDSTISIIHSFDREMETNSIQIPEEMDNIFAQTILNSIIPSNLFLPLFESKNKTEKEPVYILTTTTKTRKAFITYRPNSDDEKKCKTEINNSINLVKMLNPFIPRSLLFFNKDLALIIELQSSGLSNIHSRVYSCSTSENDEAATTTNKKKKKNENCPFYNLPFAYKINKDSLTFLWNNIDDLKGFSPSIRIALNASDFQLFGSNKKQNKSEVTSPSISQNCRSVFEIPSHLFILSDKRIPNLGEKIKFETFSEDQDSALPNFGSNFIQKVASTLPKSCKVTSDSFMFIVKIPKASVIVNMNHKDRKSLEKSMKNYVKKNIFADSKSKKLFIPFPQFLNGLEVEINNVEQFPDNISFDTENSEFPLNIFSVDEIKRSIAEQLLIENTQELIEISKVGKYCFYLKINKMVGDVNDDDDIKEQKIVDAIRAVTSEYGELNISHHYNLFTFSFPVLEHQGLVYKDRFDQINSQIIPKFSPFIFEKLKNGSEIPQYGTIKFDIFSENAVFQLSKFIRQKFEGENLTRAIEISYPHPILKEHQQTKGKVDSWILANNDKMHKEGSEWVGSVYDVEKLENQFKIDLENKVFQFEYRPFFVPIEKFKKIREDFEKDGFQDYEYNKLYELLIIKPENFDLDEGQFQKIEKEERKFCLRVCKGSYPFKKRLPLYDVESDSWNTIYTTFCEECVFHSIREITKDYFTSNDVMNDASKIVFASYKEGEELAQIETKFKPLDFLLQKENELKIEKTFSVPIGQFLWFLIDQSSQKVTQYIRAWLNMAADVAVHQCQMISCCPQHLSQIVKLSKSRSDVLKCEYDENCQNCFHMKCLRWHDSLPPDADGKKSCKIQPIGFDLEICPNCNVQSLNLFNNIIIFCDRCGCNWCYLCKIVIEKEKVMKHLREFHDSHFVL